MTAVALVLLAGTLALQIAVLHTATTCKRLMGRIDFELEQARKTGRLP